MVGIEGLEEADAPAVLGKCVTNSGQRRLARRVGGGAYVMACSLSQETQLLRVHICRRAEGVEFAVLSQVGDLLQCDHPMVN